MKANSDNGRHSSARSLWLWVILAFVVLISAWAALITIATRNQPEVVEIEGQKPQG
jgi:4-amino-4-deoxy-L-arabinose transferase-like glycosyltransferase